MALRRPRAKATPRVRILEQELVPKQSENSRVVSGGKANELDRIHSLKHLPLLTRLFASRHGLGHASRRLRLGQISRSDTLFLQIN